MEFNEEMRLDWSQNDDERRKRNITSKKVQERIIKCGCCVKKERNSSFNMAHCSTFFSVPHFSPISLSHTEVGVADDRCCLTVIKGSDYLLSKASGPKQSTPYPPCLPHSTLTPDTPWSCEAMRVAANTECLLTMDHSQTEETILTNEVLWVPVGLRLQTSRDGVCF